MKKSLLFLCSFIYCVLANAQATGDYRSNATGAWDNIATWQRFDGVSWLAASSAPTSSDGVISILNGHTVTVNVSTSADQVIVNNGGTLSIASGTFTLNDGAGDDLQVNGSLSITGGTITGTGDVLLNNTADWSGGTISAPFNVASSGTLSLSTTNNRFLTGATLVNNGTINFSAGTLYLTNGTVSNTNAMMANDGTTIADNGGTNSFANAGSFSKLGSSGTATISVQATNSGSIAILNGDVSIGAALNNTGQVNFASPGTHFNNGSNISWNAGSTITGTGTFNNTGTLTLNTNLVLPASVTLVTTGTINGASDLTVNSDLSFTNIVGGGNLTVNGNTTWNGGSLGKNFTVQNTRTFSLNTTNNKFINGANVVNNGTIALGGGTLYLTNCTITNSNALTANDATSIADNGGTNSFVNAGSFSKLGTSGVSTIGVQTTSSGSIGIVNGDVSIGAAFTNTGQINFVSPGTHFNNSSNLYWNAGSTITGTGTLNNSGTLTLNTNMVVPASVSLVTPGTINGAGDLTVNSDLSFANIIGGGNLTVNGNTSWDGGSLGKNFTVQSTRTLSLNTGNNKFINGANAVNNGTVSLGGGTIYLTNCTLTNNNAFTANDGTSIADNGGTNSFVNAGTFSKLGSSGISSISVLTTNSGTIALVNGDVSMGAALTNSGQINFVSPGTHFNNSSTFSWNAGSTITGTGTLNNTGTVTLNINMVVPASVSLITPGTINGPSDLTVNSDLSFANIIGGGNLVVNGNTSWDGGSLGKNCTVQATRTLSLNTGNNKFINGANLINNGTVSLGGGIIYLTNCTLTNNNAFTANDGTGIADNGGANSFLNIGSFSKLGASGTATISVSTTNSGTIDLVNGDVSMGNSMNNTGQINFVSPASHFNNTSVFSWNAGGSMTGTGTFNNTGTLTLNTNLVVPPTISLVTPGTINGPSDLTVNSDLNFVNIIGGGNLIVNANTSWDGGGSLGKNFDVQSSRTFSLNTTNNKFILGITLTNDGTINHNAGIVYVTNTSIINNNVFNVNNQSIADNGGTNSFTNNGSLIKLGTGTMTISIATTNTATGNIMGTGDYNFANTFTDNGKISPGTSPGILGMNGQQPLSANSTLNIEMLNNSGPGTGFDQLTRTSNLTLAGTLNVTQLASMPGGTYTIIDVPSGVTGTFANINLPPGYSVIYNPTNVMLSLLSVPLKLVSFRGKIIDNKIELDWQTAQEQNTNHFDIQRSADGHQFTSIGQLKASGNTTLTTNYQFVDEHPLEQNNFYRLKMIDDDNSFEYSPVVKVNLYDKPMITVKPNPVVEFIVIEGASQFKDVQVLDATGKMVRTMKMNSSGNFYLGDLKAGTYILRLINETDVRNLLFMKR